jgi:hypothetical protein
MALNTETIQRNVRLYYHISEQEPSLRDRGRIIEIGGVLIHLTPQHFVHYYRTWNIDYRRRWEARGKKDALEPFAGMLVRSTAGLQTMHDHAQDLLEQKLEDGGMPPEEEAITLRRATTNAKKIAQNPEKTADSIPLEVLASLIGQVAIHHSDEDRRVREFANRYKRGTLTAADLYELSQQVAQESVGFPGEEEIEIIDDSIIDRAVQQAEEAEPNPALQADLADEFLADRLNRLSEIVTTYQASDRLRRESEVFGFIVAEQ